MIKITYKGNTKEIEADPSASILDLVHKYFDCELSGCAKKGSCGRCVCRVRRKDEYLSLLSCSSRALDGDEILCDFREKEHGLHKFKGDASELLITTEDTAENEAEGTSPEATDGLHNFAAIDLGTTSIGFSYKGKTRVCLNPQLRYGSDVISRMSAAQSGKAEEIKRLTLECIGENLEDLDPDKTLRGAFIAANTAMVHLLMGYDTTSLGCAPFKGVSLKEEHFAFGRFEIYVLPGASAFIGSDAISGAYFVENEPGYDGGDYLLVDLGTNAEMIYKKGDGYLALSAAAGPAFSGDASLNLEGSEMISLTAKGLRDGVIDRTGLLADEYFETGYPVNGHVLKQEHIRNIQLAKAAIACSFAYLIRMAGNPSKAPEDLNVYITGAFGYRLSIPDLMEIGLFPGAGAHRIKVPGNSSLKGIEYALKNEKTSDIYMGKLEDIIQRMNILSLPDLEDFGEKYYLAMGF